MATGISVVLPIVETLGFFKKFIKEAIGGSRKK